MEPKIRDEWDIFEADPDPDGDGDVDRPWQDDIVDTINRAIRPDNTDPDTGGQL